MDGARVVDLLPLHHQNGRVELWDLDVGDCHSGFNTVPGHDGTGSDAERAERLSTGEAFALSKRAVQSDIQVLARRSGQEAGIPNVEKGSGPASRGQYERTLRGPREFRIRMHRLNRFVSIRSENPLEIIYLPFRRSIEGVARGSTSISINGY